MTYFDKYPHGPPTDETGVIIQPEFVPESREDWRYLLREGVTAFWDGTKVPSFSQLAAWEFGEFPDTEYMRKAAERGKMVHLTTELYDKDELEPESIIGSPHDLVGYLEAWKNFKAERKNPKFDLIEKAMHGYAPSPGGVLYLVRPDRVVTERGVSVIWDIKSKGVSFKGTESLDAEMLRRYQLELAAQAIAVMGGVKLAKSSSCLAECVFVYPSRDRKTKEITWSHSVLSCWLPDAVDDFCDLCNRWSQAVGYDESWRKS